VATAHPRTSAIEDAIQCVMGAGTAGAALKRKDFVDSYEVKKAAAGIFGQRVDHPPFARDTLLHAGIVARIIGPMPCRDVNQLCMNDISAPGALRAYLVQPPKPQLPSVQRPGNVFSEGRRLHPSFQGVEWVERQAYRETRCRTRLSMLVSTARSIF
jgi:hypothetical protein